MKKILAILMALLLTMAMLTACGASGGNTAADNNMEVGYAEEQKDTPAESPAGEVLYSSSAGSSVGSEAGSEQKLIKKVSIDAETEDLEALLAALTEQITGLNGYVENQEIYNGSSYSSYRYRSASLTVRIPAENLDSFVAEVRGISNVVTYNESAEDVTLSYVATESRVAALEAEEERLLALMEKAETMADLLVIEERLTEVRSELESTASQLRVLANKVSYATVYLNLEQVKVYTEVEEPGVWERITGGFSENLKNIGENLVDFLVWAITYSPQLIFWAVVIAIAVTVARRKLKPKKKKQDKPEQQA